MTDRFDYGLRREVLRGHHDWQLWHLTGWCLWRLWRSKVCRKRRGKT